MDFFIVAHSGSIVWFSPVCFVSKLGDFLLFFLAYRLGVFCSPPFGVEVFSFSPRSKDWVLWVSDLRLFVVAAICFYCFGGKSGGAFSAGGVDGLAETLVFGVHLT